MKIHRPAVKSQPLKAVATIAKKAASKKAIPENIVKAALEGENNRILQSRALNAYNKQRAMVSEFMSENGIDTFEVSGMVDGQKKKVLVTYENSSRQIIDIERLLQVSGLSLKKLYDSGVFTTSISAVENNLGPVFAAQATVPGTPNYQAKFKSL